MLSNFRVLTLTCLLIASVLPTAKSEAEERTSGFDANLGASYEFGQLGNNGMNLQDRWMTAISVEALPGYRLNKRWLFGLDVNYRWQQQQTALADAGGTNLAGKGWLVGAGTNYQFSPSWAMQAAIDFLGRYEFDRQTAGSQDDHLQFPLNLRMKLQYFINDRFPLSFDLSANYLMWNTFNVGGVDRSERTNQWMAGAGLTYHFGAFGSRSSAPMDITTEIESSQPPATKPRLNDGNLPPAPEPVGVVTSQETELSKTMATEKTESGLKIKIESAAFKSGSPNLTADFKAKLREVGVVLAKSPKQKLKIDGYTDSSGTMATNNRLSKQRADNVKQVLVESGIESSRVTTSGMGPQNPIADNATSEGRAKNRRVEIKIED